tara:strand:- start:9877 stop:10455 length:579 start_codon:yes stop_codon:yes gene_type:complete
MKILFVIATISEIQKEKFTFGDVLITGVGMLNTAIVLTKKLSEEKYDLVINLGIAGSFKESIKIGDVVEVFEEKISEIGYEDKNEFAEFADFSLKTVFRNNSHTDLKQVKSITVNTVHGNEKSIKNIVRRLNPDIENMEGAAVFKVCEIFNISCIQIRAISNFVEKRNKENWNIPLAIKNLNVEVEKIISNL